MEGEFDQKTTYFERRKTGRKTSIVRKFATENFEEFVEINLEKSDYKNYSEM